MWELEQCERVTTGFMWVTTGTGTGSFKKSHKFWTSIEGRELFNQVDVC
jgi:hypothetical protein